MNRQDAKYAKKREDGSLKSCKRRSSSHHPAPLFTDRGTAPAIVSGNSWRPWRLGGSNRIFRSWFKKLNRQDAKYAKKREDGSLK
ncbi:MAG: hypothetical protein WCL32_22265, partial [Planctomycetota bacterium]